MLANTFCVDTKNVEKKDDEIISTYTYETSKIVSDKNGVSVVPCTKKIQFKTNTKIPKLGVMIIGWGGNNGTTVTNGILANKLSLKWDTKRGEVKANYHGSLTQCSTTYLGQDDQGKTYVAPFKSLVPMVEPNDIVISGWDISKLNIYEATKRAKVLEPTMYNQLKDQTEKMIPLPAVFDLSFVAPNQESRADNVIEGNKEKQLETVRQNIKDFKTKNNLDKVIILWNGNTERFCEVDPKIHGTAEALLNGIKNNEKEISPSIIYCMASILEHCPYINGSPQNTFVPGVVDLAEKEGVILMGDDMKTGQTKLKSVMADFLINSGLKLTAVASYNHLGNNDGLNLDYYKCFKSKEISKASVIDDIVGYNPILYPNQEHPDHLVVIKYVPSVGDSKRALDEYDSGIFCGGENIISIHNTCEDSLLAAPLIVDMIILMEAFSRIMVKDEKMEKFKHMACIHSVLSFLFKAPRTPNNSPVINSLFQQRACLENTLRACRGLPPLNHMHLEWKMPSEKQNES